MAVSRVVRWADGAGVLHMSEAAAIRADIARIVSRVSTADCILNNAEELSQLLNRWLSPQLQTTMANNE